MKSTTFGWIGWLFLAAVLASAPAFAAEDDASPPPPFMAKLSGKRFSNNHYQAVLFGKILLFKGDRQIPDKGVVRLTIVKAEDDGAVVSTEVINGEGFLFQFIPGSYTIKNVWYNGRYYRVQEQLSVKKENLVYMGILEIHARNETREDYEYEFRLDTTMGKQIFDRNPEFAQQLAGNCPPGYWQSDRSANVFVPNYQFARGTFKEKKSLQKAAQDGDAATVAEYLKAGVAVDAPDPDGDTPLMLALIGSHADIARTLIAKGASATVQAPDGWTALMLALRYSLRDLAPLLVDKGADVNAMNKNGWTPLLFSLRYGQPDDAKFLIQKGARIDVASKDGWTPFMFALQFQGPEMAAFLMDKGADLQGKDSDGWTPLMYALRFGKKDIARALIEKGSGLSEKNRDGWSPLMFAIRNDQGANADLLLSEGVPLNDRSKDGWTPLNLALRFGQPDIAKRLIEMGADISPKTNDGVSMLMFALEYGQADNARLLIQKGADMDAKDQDGWTPLMYAIRYGSTDLARTLAEKTTGVNVREKSGWTALVYALRYDQSDVAALLITKGVELNLTLGDGWTPLMVALRNNQAENARTLILKGADINAVTKYGWTALLFALNNNQPENAKLLIQRGADLSAKASSGETPQSLAEAKGYLEIQNILRTLAPRQATSPAPTGWDAIIPHHPAARYLKKDELEDSSSLSTALVELDAPKKQVLAFYRDALVKAGWRLDQAMGADTEGGTLSNPNLWGLINVVKDSFTLTMIMLSDQKSGTKKTQVDVTLINREPGAHIAEFLQSLPRAQVAANQMNQRFASKEWGLTVLSAANEGRTVSNKDAFSGRVYSFAATGQLLVRVMVTLERLDGKAIEKSFLSVGVKLRDAAGRLYPVVAAGTGMAEYYDLAKGGVQSVLVPVQPKSDVEYLFAVPEGAVPTELLWPGIDPIRIQLR